MKTFWVSRDKKGIFKKDMYCHSEKPKKVNGVYRGGDTWHLRHLTPVFGFKMLKPGELKEVTVVEVK